MKNAIILGIIFLFVCWCLYSLYTTEGFQDSASPSGVNLAEEAKCSIVSGSYYSLKERYDNAVASNNELQINRLAESMNAMKGALDLMGCTV
jgi:hypothetical protein